MTKLMMAGLLVLVAAGMTLSVRGDTLCSGESAQVSIDLTPGTRRTSGTETIRYSTAWDGAAPEGAVAVIEVDGMTLLEGSGSGAFAWTPPRNGTYTLTHRVLAGGEQVGETLTAVFEAAGLNPDDPVIYPASGTAFSGSLSVSISCPTAGAAVHYTTNGTEPTAESPLYQRFRITGRTTVKAVAVKDGFLSGVVSAEYAPGRCADPVVSPADGMVFEHSGQKVSIIWSGADGTLRYTTDGSDPTRESPAYAGPFTVSESVVVKARAFGDQFFDSGTVTAGLTRVWVSAATPAIDAPASFTGAAAKVVISCATGGATVRYTLDGSEPNSHSAKYTAPLHVTGSCTVKAYAAAADYLNSAVASFAVEKVWGIGDALGAPDHGFSTEGDGGAGWTRVEDAAAPGGEAMRSGAITHGQASVLSTTVTGPGTLTFS